jgi:hypothetical protein
MANRSFRTGSAKSWARWGLVVYPLLAGCGAETADQMATAVQTSTATQALLDGRGAVSCDFDFALTVNPLTIAPIIERDRMYMAERPGMQEKHIPFSPQTLMLRARTGGRYLFDSYQRARHYLTWVQQDYVLDGVHFFQRADFINPVCHVWEVVGAWEPGDPRTSHHFIRTERLRGPAGLIPPQLRALLEARWDQLRADAQQRQLTGARLLYSPDEQLIEIVYLASNAQFSLLGLQSLPSLGLPLIEDGSSREFDRTQFVLTVWFPFVLGDLGEPAPFPNTPPLPGPLCSDGVCEVSRGESRTTCMLDCPVHCGDATCQSGEGESTTNCPGDCRL